MEGLNSYNHKDNIHQYDGILQGKLEYRFVLRKPNSLLDLVNASQMIFNVQIGDATNTMIHNILLTVKTELIIMNQI